MSDLLPSIQRTWVPLVVGWLLALPITGPILEFFGVTPDEASTGAAAAVSAGVTGVYYLVARLIELYVLPRLGGLMIGLHPTLTPAYTRDRDAEGSDDGSFRAFTAICAALTALAVAVLVLVAGPASARRGPEPSGQVVSPRVTRTGVCDGVLVVHFDAQSLAGRVWSGMLDDGRAGLEVHQITGRWVGAATESGGERVLRWEGYAKDGAGVDLARVVVGGYRSPGAPTTAEPCA
jgi:hypothetical protein